MNSQIELDRVNEMVLCGYRDLLSVDDLVEIFQVSKKTIYKELVSGKFGKPIRIGRAYKIPKIYILRNFFSSIQ